VTCAGSEVADLYEGLGVFWFCESSHLFSAGSGLFDHRGSGRIPVPLRWSGYGQHRSRFRWRALLLPSGRDEQGDARDQYLFLNHPAGVIACIFFSKSDRRYAAPSDTRRDSCGMTAGDDIFLQRFISPSGERLVVPRDISSWAEGTLIPLATKTPASLELFFLMSGKLLFGSLSCKLPAPYKGGPFPRMLLLFGIKFFERTKDFAERLQEALICTRLHRNRHVPV